MAEAMSDARPFNAGPEPGRRVPDFTLPDQHGRPRAFAGLCGPQGLVIVFHRSADW